MAQISKGDTFTDGQQVTGARLNQLVDSSTLLVGAITDQPSITANTLEATDSTIVNDAGVLKEATIGDILNSNLPITTSAISGNGGVDLVVTPPAGKKLDVAGAFEADSINSVGALTVGGNATVTGDLTVTGNFGGNINTSGNISSSGTANFTGSFQFNGSAVYALAEIFEQTPAPWTAAVGINNNIFTSSSFTKPSDEIWVFEVFIQHQGARGYTYSFAGRYGSQSAQSGAYLFAEHWYDGNGGGGVSNNFYTARWVVPAGTAITSDTFKIDAFAASGSGLQMFQTSAAYWGTFITGSVASSKFRIYKYKTA